MFVTFEHFAVGRTVLLNNFGIVCNTGSTYREIVIKVSYTTEIADRTALEILGVRNLRARSVYGG